MGEEKLKLLEEVEAVPTEELANYTFKRARLVVERTQGDSWNDPEEYQIETIELAHAVFRQWRDDQEVLKALNKA